MSTRQKKFILIIVTLSLNLFGNQERVDLYKDMLSAYSKHSKEVKSALPLLKAIHNFPDDFSKALLMLEKPLSSWSCKLIYMTNNRKLINQYYKQKFDNQSKKLKERTYIRGHHFEGSIQRYDQFRMLSEENRELLVRNLYNQVDFKYFYFFIKQIEKAYYATDWLKAIQMLEPEIRVSNKQSEYFAYVEVLNNFYKIVMSAMTYERNPIFLSDTSAYWNHGHEIYKDIYSFKRVPPKVHDKLSVDAKLFLKNVYKYILKIDSINYGEFSLKFMDPYTIKGLSKKDLAKQVERMVQEVFYINYLELYNNCNHVQLSKDKKSASYDFRDVRFSIIMINGVYSLSFSTT